MVDADPHGPELSDLVLDHDPETGVRRPVSRDRVVATMRERGFGNAARVAAAMPVDGEGFLLPDAVDATLLRCHAELQRLSEEFGQGRRVLTLLRPLLEVLREENPGQTIRIVDVGCGLGFVLRWLAAHGDLGEDVELLGCDFNRALIDAAEASAREEQLSCRFLVEDAFALSTPGTVFMSTGVIHHFRGEGLVRFFAAQDQPTTRAFLHYDIQPTWLAPLGSWLFHTARMREPLARHDGVASARRAHPNQVLLDAARAGTPRLSIGLFDVEHGPLPVLRVLRPVVGLAPGRLAPLRERLGSAARRLEAFE